ncbi:hypothetical protein MLD38_017781 [Melastoma candidum]|uniref:Uncharacterized protein n=1 Tax=Melastoma candidum TaxID=119954 RepID=A0ACB9QT30_9MYRT|nr:hypothetical protein MLD38_017781 [Melastoma candidum]
MISAAASSAFAILPIAYSRNVTPPGCSWPIKLGGVAMGKDRSSAAEGLGVAPVPEDDSDVLIECRDVYKSFGEKRILKGVSFKGKAYIRGKKRAGLVGDNEMSGLLIGLVFQSAAVFDSLTVRENVGFLPYENSNMLESMISKLVTETLAAVGLKLDMYMIHGTQKKAGVEDRLPSELSGGMKKCVALARSIICDDTNDTIELEVLLYDEPTAGLDPIASTVVEDLIRSVHLKIVNTVDKPGNVVWQGMTHEFTTSENPIVRQFASGSLDGPIRY